MADYQDTYSRMSNDELLNLAQEADELAPLGKVALNTELEKRKLGPAEIAEQLEYLRSVEIEAARKRPLAQTFNGFGTKIYGKRDFEPDGSFLTTKWVVFFWIPLVPLKSLRVRYVGPGDASALPGWSRKYLVYAEYGPHTRQVVAVYSFMISVLVGARALDWLHADSLVASGAFAVWASAPWLLRWRAKRVAPQSANATGQHGK
jgi:hypothetical protein